MLWTKHHFDALDSTQDEARAYPPYSVVVAERQTRGRGRMGRTWESPAGNLYLTAVVPDFGDRTPQLAFVAAVALAEALADFPVRLKWPNDVLLDGRKIAGILLERAEGKVLVGVGVNVVSAPDLAIYATGHLQGRIFCDILLDRFLKELREAMGAFQEKGFEPIRRKWLAGAFHLGQDIIVKMPQGTAAGVFAGIDADGALMLKQADTIKRITVGDVALMKDMK
ncbi:MAG: biotin--[acetyl-CoA-carboxylase] ligase [Alphaproteobacteria bacterium]|nr:biotin--[acetyl-CoA-carboxylase] ligase [Alphaproteobacteria bacterium]